MDRQVAKTKKRRNVMRNGKKILTGCLLAVAVSVLMVGCGNDDKNKKGTETTAGTNTADTNVAGTNTAGTNTVDTNRTENSENNETTKKDTVQNDGVLEDVGAGIGEAGDDIIDGAANAVERLADDVIDRENTGNTNTETE